MEMVKQPNRYRLALILGALAAIGPLSIDMYLPALPGLAQDLDTSPALVQLSLTFFLLGLALGQLFVGPLSDVKGRRGPLLIGLIAYTLSSLLCALSVSVWLLLGLRFIQGLAGAAGVAISRAIVRDLYSGPELTRFYAGLMLVSGVAPVLAPIVGGQLLKVTSWEGVFYVLTGFGVVLSGAVLLSIPETLPLTQRSAGGLRNTSMVLGQLLKDRSFMGYALSQGLVSGALFAYISGSPFVLQNMFGVSPQLFSVLFAINSVGIIVASQATGRLAGRLGESRLFVTGLIMACTGGILVLVAVLLDLGLWGILPALFMVVSSVGMVGSAGVTLALQNQGQVAGSASGLLGVMSFIMGALIAPLVGLGGSHTAVPFGAVIAFASTGALISYILLIVPIVDKEKHQL